MNEIAQKHFGNKSGIKVAFWDSQFEKYHPASSNVIMDCLTGKLKGRLGGPGWCEKLIPLQFIGFIDQCDKEIHEGDLLSVKVYRQPYGSSKAKSKHDCMYYNAVCLVKDVHGRIEFVDGEFERLRAPKGKEQFSRHVYLPSRIDKLYGFYFDDKSKNGEIKVIGNIFKNPELFTK